MLGFESKDSCMLSKPSSNPAMPPALSTHLCSLYALSPAMYPERGGTSGTLKDVFPPRQQNWMGRVIKLISWEAWQGPSFPFCCTSNKSNLEYPWGQASPWTYSPTKIRKLSCSVLEEKKNWGNHSKISYRPIQGKNGGGGKEDKGKSKWGLRSERRQYYQHAFTIHI